MFKYVFPRTSTDGGVLPQVMNFAKAKPGSSAKGRGQIADQQTKSNGFIDALSRRQNEDKFSSTGFGIPTLAS
jgi:hypothetical protein